MIVISPAVTEIIYEIERRQLDQVSPHRAEALAEMKPDPDASVRAWIARALVRAGMFIDARAGRRVTGVGGC